MNAVELAERKIRVAKALRRFLRGIPEHRLDEVIDALAKETGRGPATIRNYFEHETLPPEPGLDQLEAALRKRDMLP